MLAYLAAPFLASDTETGVLQGTWRSVFLTSNTVKERFNPTTARISEKNPF